MTRTPTLSLTLALLASSMPLLTAEDAPATPPAPGETVRVTAQTSSGPTVSPNGSNSYGVTSLDIDHMPLGSGTSLTDVLSQMPGVAIDQYQMVHIRDNEGAGFQYQINGILVPLDINTNPPFLSMLNSTFIDRVDLLDGILPSKYSYAIGGVVDIQTKDGFSKPGGSLDTMVGQRNTIQETAQYGGSSGKFSYYVSGRVGENDTAFSSASPGPNAYHDHQDLGQGFGYFSYLVAPTTKLSLIISASTSNNQLPNIPNQPTEFDLAGATAKNSSDIDSGLNMRDYLGLVALNSQISQDVTYQLAVGGHYISQQFNPDNAQDLIYQGVAPTVRRDDHDVTAQGDLYWHKDAGTVWSAGFYAGSYHITSNSSTLVFPVDGNGDPTSNVPQAVNLNLQKNNYVTGLYVNDQTKITEDLSANVGLRWDTLSGMTKDSRLDPTLSLTCKATRDTTIHAGFAQYMQVPTFSGIAPSAPAAFAGTTAEQSPGQSFPDAEHDLEWDFGIVNHPFKGGTISWNTFFEITHHYLDAGLFGDVPIYSPLNYDKGYIWGSELALAVKVSEDVGSYINYTMGQNYQKGVATGQFNFSDPALLNEINNHYFLLDHEPLAELNAGVTYQLRPFVFSLDCIYSSGLRTGFADDVRLPTVFQVNAGCTWSFNVPGVGLVSNRITILNLFDKINLIRPADGIGVFQASYGPRFTVYDTLSIPF